MKFRKNKWMTMLLAALLLFGTFGKANQVEADEVDAPYLALGADLTEDEKNTVLNLLGVDPANLDQYMVVTITNADEHAYLDSYLDSGVIGTRALSSVVVEKKEEGTGIQVKTSNITYCTTGMYQNALATAGLADAEIRVAGPFNISGTAALVGAMKAYGEMTGQTISADNADAATEELVTTSELGETIGDQDKAEALIGAVKDAVVSADVTDPEEIETIIADTADELNIQLSDSDKAKIRQLMEKISTLDLDVNSLKAQAKDLYEKMENMGLDISEEDVQGFFAAVIAWLKRIWEMIKGWFGL